MTSSTPKAPQRVWPWTLGGAIVTLGMLGGIGYWSATARIDGAVIAPATVAVETKRKAVQHLEGGIVSEVLILDGARVRAGQPLIHLDDTQALSERTAGRERLTALGLRDARLRAEMAEEVEFDLPEALVGTALAPRLAQMIETERSLLSSRTASRLANRDLLERRILSLRAERDGERRQRVTALAELILIETEIVSLESLLARQLVQSARVLELRRAAARLTSEIARFETRADSLDAQVAEAEADLRRASADGRAATASERADVQAEIVALEERMAVLDDRLARSIIRAPEDGRVLDLAVSAAGEVIAPGQQVLEIVPYDDRLVVVADVSPGDIERLSEGQEARVRLTGFNQNTTGELLGEVIIVSADALTDLSSGESIFSTVVALDPDAVRSLGDMQLLPGMPAEVLITTGERAPWSYFARPLVDAYARSFRDD